MIRIGIVVDYDAHTVDVFSNTDRLLEYCVHDASDPGDPVWQSTPDGGMLAFEDRLGRQIFTVYLFDLLTGASHEEIVYAVGADQAVDAVAKRVGLYHCTFRHVCLPGDHRGTGGSIG